LKFLSIVKRAIPTKVKTLTRRIFPEKSDISHQFYLSASGKRAIIKKYKDDRFLLNYHLNIWEYYTGQIRLETYPWIVTLPIASACNAKCTFCTAWLHQTKSLLHPDQVDRLEALLRHARQVGLISFGEPLLNPYIDEIVAKCRTYMDDRASFFLVTNGLLLGTRLESLIRSKVYGYSVSVNAATDQTHHKVMGLGRRSFSKILKTIESLVELRNEKNPSLHIGVGFVLCKDNLHEAANFVRLFTRIGVDRIDIRTLIPMISHDQFAGLNYHLLPPYFHKEFVKLADELRAEIERSGVHIVCDPDSWGAPLIAEGLAKSFEDNPPSTYSWKEALEDPELMAAYRVFAEVNSSLSGRGARLQIMNDCERRVHEEQTSYIENPLNRRAHFKCAYPYHYFLIQEMNFRVSPCCYFYNVPGHELLIYDEGLDFLEIWNSPAYLELRRRLKEGTMFKMCTLCQNQGKQI
jgi:MoaA/NifB/PqqE/SkfB family radical SAM enzyme